MVLLTILEPQSQSKINMTFIESTARPERRSKLGTHRLEMRSGRREISGWRKRNSKRNEIIV
jgi:hypothetical protein